MVEPVVGLDKLHPSSGRRIAIIVGVNHAPGADVPVLAAAENDAQTVAAAILDSCCGFTLAQPPLIGSQATSQAIKDALIDQIEALGADDLLLFYFSGHGQPITIEAGREDVYLVSSDFSEQRVKRDENRDLSMRWLQDKLLRSTGVGKIIIMLDCCYAGWIGEAAPDPYLADLHQRITQYFDIQSTGDPYGPSEARITLAASSPTTTAKEQDGRGRFTSVLLDGLAGKASDDEGYVTVLSLEGYLKRHLAGDQVPGRYGFDRSARLDLAYNASWSNAAKHASNEGKAQQQRSAERKKQLHAALIDHSSFINNRLASFVGRVSELAEIRQRITSHLSTGGYVTITGEAGQGKSSIIARLVADHAAPDCQHVAPYEPEALAYHFIPFNPGPDHQVSLLRNLIARLALKHNLSEIYIASESRPALREYFAKVINEISASGTWELIFIDGLDQIEEDLRGQRDLSFLPTDPPPGIVFVLGTRPNDTLAPLELLKPHNKYPLPDLSRADFGRILQHHNVPLATELADRFYQVMEGNALYLDLAAREIRAAGALSPEQIIRQIADDPANLFSLAIERLKRPRDQWHEVIKPVLGALLASRESLSHVALRALTRADGDALRDGLQRLGGLVARDDRSRYYLYHLKFRDFLSYDPDRPDRKPVFDRDEAQGYHQRLVAWCEGGKGGLPMIWHNLTTDRGEQERRVYARQHYITHLAEAANWERLWVVIDDGDYGHAKLRHDPSTRSYVQDLDRGRQAVIDAEDGEDPGQVILSRLWRYSLLRGTLASQADNYPIRLFIVLAQIGRAQEAIGLAELLSDASRKTLVLCRVGLALDSAKDGTSVAQPIIARAIEVARSIEHPAQRIVMFLILMQELAEAGLQHQASALSQEATRVAHTIKDGFSRAEALSTIAQALATAGQHTAAVDLARTIERAHARVEALSAIAQALATAGQHTAAVDLARTIERAHARVEALSAIAQVLAEAGQQEAATTLCEEAANLARTIEDANRRAQALSAIAQVLAEAGQQEAATTLCEEAANFAHTIEDADSRAQALSAAAEALAKAGQYTTAADLAHTIQDAYRRVQALTAVAQTLAEAGQHTAAVDLARTIEDADRRVGALSVVAQALAKAGQYTAAVDLARTIERAHSRALALSRIAQTLVEAGQYTAAVDLAHTIEDVSIRSEALSAVAEVLAEAGQQEAATTLCEEAANLARTNEDADSRALALSRVAQALAEAGQHTAAVDLAHTIEDVGIRSEALSAVAEVLAEAGQQEAATTLCEEAANFAHTIEDADSRAFALSRVPQALATAGQHTAAVDLARTIEDVGTRVGTLSVVAQVLAEAGQQEAATTLCEETQSIARTIQDAYRRARALSTVAEVLAEAGQHTAAVDLALTVEDVDSRAQALCVVAHALAKAGQYTAAVDLARTIERATIRALALSRVAQALAEAGQHTAAIDLAHTIDDVGIRVEGLSAVAQTLAEAAQQEAAVTLCEEAQSIAGTIEEAYTRAEAFSAVAQALAKAGQHTVAIDLAHTIEDAYTRDEGLSVIAQVLAKAGQHAAAVDLAHTIENVYSRVQALSAVAQALDLVHDSSRLRALVHQSWFQATNYQELWGLLALAQSLINANCALIPSLLPASDWVSDFLKAPSPSA